MAQDPISSLKHKHPTVTSLVNGFFKKLQEKGELTERTLRLYRKLLNSKIAENFIDIMEENLPEEEKNIKKDGLISVEKLGGYDEKGTPFLYLVTLGYFCNGDVPRREKIKLLTEKVVDDKTKQFLKDICYKGMNSDYLSKAFNNTHAPELKGMLDLITAVVNKN